MKLDLNTFCEATGNTLSGLISDMFTFTEWYIDEKSEGDYRKVRDELKTKREDICIEDVYSEMLLAGYVLTATDPDGEEHDFALSNVEEGIDALFFKCQRAFADFLTGDQDAVSGLALIDCCIFGEPTFC